MNKYRIMFVCHGNICRSPMAEFIFKDMLKKRGLDGRFQVSSSATSDEEIWGGVGNPVYPPARRQLLAVGIDPVGKRAVQLTCSDGDRYDLFVGMDSANIRNMRNILPEAHRGKIRKLMDFTSRGGDVADPWYTGGFDVAYRDIYEGCSALLEFLLKEI